MTVHSPKTEHHEGEGSRVVPIFPELLPYLEAVRDEANLGIDCPNSSPVITRYRDGNANLRTQLLRIITRAGVQPWPKLFQNLRTTRQTELVEDFPAHVACAWMGNSEAVARKHYEQVTDAHFAKASTAQVPAQSEANSTRQEATEELSEDEKCCTVSSSRQLSGEGIPPRGVEPRFSD